jgi:tetratricopeptide (TPR) repeat protein
MRARLPILLVLLSVLGSAAAQDKPDAVQLYKSGKYEESIAVCLQEIQDTPRNLEPHVVIGWSYLKLKKYPEALEYGQKVLSLSRYDQRGSQIVGEALVFLGRVEEALKYLGDYVTLAPTGERIGRVYWLMGECYILLREYQNADIAFSTAVYHEQTHADWWVRLGYAREMAGDNDWSMKAYDKALALDANLADAQRGKERVGKKRPG